jgi:DNA-binding phage protein
MMDVALCPYRAEPKIERGRQVKLAMRLLEIKDVVFLLRSEVKRAGSVSRWAENAGLPREVVSRVLSNTQPPTKGIIKALGLRTVFVADGK